jgi:hypothetical protein
MRSFRNPDSEKLYRIVVEGNVFNSNKLWRLVYGPYTNLRKAREILSRNPSKDHGYRWENTWMEETEVNWKVSS